MAGKYDEAQRQFANQGGGSSPAQPRGLRQAQSSESKYAEEGRRLQQWLPTDHVASAQGWYSGANQQGTSNGWNTGFTEKYISGWDEALRENRAQDYFRDGGTGVVQWDHDSFKFGDVVEDGKVVGNVYKDHDERTANLLMLPWISDGVEQKRLWDDAPGADVIDARVREFVGERRVENNENLEKALGAMVYAGDVEETREAIQDGAGDDVLGIVGGGAGGAVTGASAGAAIGAVFGGVGAIPGAAIGGVLGGVGGAVGGWLNRDEIANKAARGWETYQLAREEHNTLAALGRADMELAGLAMSMTSPLQNLTRGVTDAVKGTSGDGVSERYNVDEFGKSTTGLGWKVADWTSLVGDSLLQFMSPLNRTIFSAQMGGMVSGQVAEIGFSGTMFDPREGGFDNIFIDDNGKADPVSAAAGMLKVGIDAVQLASVRGLARQSVAQRDAVAAGGRVTEQAGHRFILDESGKVLSAKKTMAFLAPSEQVAWLNAARKARVVAASERRAVTADDFYRAANNLAHGSSKMKSALVNAFGEGYEEFAQAYLEPLAVDGEVDHKQAVEAFLYGAAAGAGMSVGATFEAPQRDQRMMLDAYVLRSLRDGGEPDFAAFKAEWESLDFTDKQMMAARTEADASATRAAQETVAREHTASEMATTVDVAKAIDARRAMFAKRLEKASTRTDKYLVMSAQVDVGKVDDVGALLGDTAPADAVEASAFTVLELLGNRLDGFALQEESLTAELEQLEEGSDQHADVTLRLGVATRAKLFGEVFLAEIAEQVRYIYDEATTEAQARIAVRDLNLRLQTVFEMRAPAMPVIEGLSDAEVAEAGAWFVTLMHSREPKLDTGSYLALLPRASWQLTQSNSDNFLQVNTDILSSINGDFDGDKLRAENLLAFSPERFTQIRSGEFYGGSGRELDIAERAFDEGLAQFMAEGLAQSGSPLGNTATATVKAVRKAITARYGSLMSPAALSKVLGEFESALAAGSSNARLTLINGLAREAGGAITELGRANLRNEWLWISKVVRANLNAYQSEYARLRNFRGNAQVNAPTAELPVDASLETPEGTQIRKKRAAVDAQTLSLWTEGDTLFRAFQHIHYSWFNSPTLRAKNASQPELAQIAQMYRELAQFVTQPELDRVAAPDSIQGRVLVMLERLVDSALESPGMRGFNPAAAMTILANVKVKDVWFDADGNVQKDDGNLSLAQLLLKRALEQDREVHKGTFHLDADRQAKHARLEALTLPNTKDGKGKVNAERAFIEVFKDIPFQDSLGGNTGNLAAMTTPEQWLQTYIAGDPGTRRDLERFYKLQPEYLDRKESSDPPYSMKEMERGEVTPYRSMLDAMIAVGRTELTFDPSKDPEEAFSGRRADQDQMTRNQVKATHQMVREAAASFRGIRVGTRRERELNADLVRELFVQNPREGRLILDMIPDAMANSLYELKPDGSLQVVPWIYDMFAIKNPDEAAFFYWKNLTLGRWRSSLTEGREYDRLESRFLRVLFELAEQTGHLHMELLLREMNRAKSLDEFFYWVNTTPGIRSSSQAPLLPFVDDVADFEAGAAGVGWTKMSAGADLRTAIGAAERAAHQLSQTMALRATKASADRLRLDDIKDAAAGDLDPVKQDSLRKLARRVEQAKEMPRGFSPNSMLALTKGLIRGFDAGSHEKGKVPSSYAELGEFQALMDAFAFVPGAERAMEVLTGHSLSSIRTNLGDIASTGGVAMDESGREIRWEPLSLEKTIELLDDPDTAPFALMLLTPTAMDITPVGLAERLLMDASLVDVLDNDHYRELFDTDSPNRLDVDTRYVSVLDSLARAEGGNFDALRSANDFAIALTSGLKRPARISDEEEFTASAYHYVAKMMRLVGHILSTPDMVKSDMLGLLRQELKTYMRQQRAGSVYEGVGAHLQDQWADTLRNELKDAHIAQLAQLVNVTDPKDIAAATAAMKAKHALEQSRLDQLLDDDALASVVARFELSGDPVADRAQHARIEEYVMSMSNFPNRAPEATAAWTKLSGQRRAGNTVDLTAAEWDSLARAAMGITLVDETLRISSHVSVPSLPVGSATARFYKYFDKNLEFLITDLLQENTPLAKAAVKLHAMAEMPRPLLTLQSVMAEVKDLLAANEFGTWSPALMSHMVDAQQRMDSAGAPPGIAAAGNGPKRWAAIAAATARTGAVPDAALLTTTSFSADLLAETVDPFTEIPVQPAGTANTTAMPVAMLENRFYASIKVDGIEVDLAANNLGYEWHGADEPNPYRYVSLERLRPVLNEYLQKQGISPSQATVEVTFFHPDSKPAEMWHNAFFEGMSHSLLPDGSESLIATLWSDNGGRISADTQWTIDSGKKGLRAIMPFRRSSLDAGRAAAEARFAQTNDLAELLRAKAELAVKYDDGSTPLGVAAFNSVYKIMKMQHVVVGTDAEGNVTAVTADEAIAFQAANGMQLPLDNARVLALSPDVLRSVVRDTGDQAARRFFDDEFQVNPALIQRFQGLDPVVLERFLPGWASEPVGPESTSLAAVGQQRVMRVNPVMTKAERNARSERRVYLDKRQQRAHKKRFDAVRHGGSRLEDTYQAALIAGSDAILTETTRVSIADKLANAVAARDEKDAKFSRLMLAKLFGLRDPQGLERGWQIRDDGEPNFLSGVMTLEALHDGKDPADHIVRGDLASVLLSSFQKRGRTIAEEEARVEKALDFLAETGAYIVLGSGNGTGDLRWAASRYLESKGYVRVQGSRHIFEPAATSAFTQNEAAYESTLYETERITPSKQVLTFLSIDPIDGMDENAAIQNTGSVKLRDRVLVGNLLKSAGFPQFGIPVEDGRDYGLYSRTLAHLRHISDPKNTEARAALVKMAAGKKGEAKDVMPMATALNRFHKRITDRASLELHDGDTLLVGDIIPFVNGDGKTILYRHGMKMPRAVVHKDKDPRAKKPPELDLADMFAMNNNMGVATGPGEFESAATAHSGKIVNIENRSGYGKRLVLEVPLQPYGDKVQLAWNGMKYVLVPKPESFGELPAVFRNGTIVDLISNVSSADGKEAYRGRVVGLRNALAFFQFNFLDDMVEFFYPGSTPADPEHSMRRTQTLTLLQSLSRREDLRLPYADAAALAKINVDFGALLGETAAAWAANSANPPAGWETNLQDTSSATAQIARSVITYLMTPHANIDNVLMSAGFSGDPTGVDEAVTSRVVPGLFASLLEGPVDGPLHTELLRRFNGQLVSNPDGSGWRLNSDWTFEYFQADGTSRRGYLQFGEAYSSGDNPVLDGQAFHASENAGVSVHNAMAATLSTGALTTYRHDKLEKARDFAAGFTAEGKLTKFSGEKDSAVWHVLTALPTERDASQSVRRRETPAETVRRAMARDELAGTHHELNMEGDDWKGKESQFHNAAMRALDQSSMHRAQRGVIDAMIRMHLGRPYGRDEDGNELGIISFDDAMEALAKITRNLSAGRLPTADAELPLMDINHLSALFLANRDLPDSKRWKLLDNDGTEITSWDGWVEAAFGTAWTVPEGQLGLGPEPLFDPMFQLAMDGLMHGYQNATSSTRYLPVSSDLLRARLLMDPDTNKMLVSTSADENLLAQDQTISGSSYAELEEILVGQRIYAPGRNGPSPNSVKGRMAQRRSLWRRDETVPTPVAKRMRGVRAEGQAFIGYTTSTSGWLRSMMNLRVAQTLFNLSLAVAAPFEAFLRRTQNMVTGALSGEGTGMVGQAQTKLSDKLGDSRVGALAKQAGFETMLTGTDMKDLNSLADALATLPEFKAMIYKELMFLYPTVPGIGRVERWLEEFARFGAKMQDPAWGMLPRDLARTYLDAVMRYKAQNPTSGEVYSIRTMKTAMARNPMWVKGRDPEAHNLGIAAVANVRSLKPNLLSLGFRGLIEPWSANPSIAMNTTGNMLKIMTAFQNFWANFGVNITGLNGPVEFVTFLVDGREKKLGRRIQAAVGGREYRESLEETEYYDMSEALESLDVADAFIRTGTTHTALFLLGMGASGLGLSGEDEEMKLRRRQAELQGVPVLHDPRDLQADFRNKDSIYLNWLPLGMDAWFKADPNNPDSDAIGQMNWVARTFISPIIGFERFYNTGDFSEILHGFKDAVGAHPIVNAQLWNAASDTSAYLHQQAVDASDKGDYVEASHLLITAVSVLEGMLFENAMINMVYQGMDQWDRDPYVLTLKDSDGVLQRDIEGNSRANDLALKSFINEDGEVMQGYLGRSQRDSDIRVMTENRATAAFIASVFSGGIGDSDYWRYNMAIKTREIDMPEADQEEVEALVRAAAAFQLSLIKAPNLTAEEVKPGVANIMYNQAKASGTFNPNLDDLIWQQARATAAEYGLAAASIIDEHGIEQMTSAGARYLYNGLRAGTITLDSPEMRNIHIPMEMRQKVAADWSKELVQEGIDLGLDETKARSRMARLMQGGFDGPEAARSGLADMLFDKRIPYSDKRVYGQMNTTYVMGPDGKPWAAGFRRDGLIGALGLKPIKAMLPTVDRVTTRDERGNTVDLVAGTNTGLRGLVPFDDSRNVPTDVEIGKAIEDAIKAASNADYTPREQWEKGGGGSGSGWRNFGRRGYGGGGYGGGGGAYFNKMYGVPDNVSPYGNNAPFINTSNPILRRAFVRRERISSERGRLNQWQ